MGVWWNGTDAVGLVAVFLVFQWLIKFAFRMAVIEEQDGVFLGTCVLAPPF